MLRAIIYTNYLIMYEQTHAHIKIIRTINYKIHKQYQILLMSAFQFLTNLDPNSWNPNVFLAIYSKNLSYLISIGDKLVENFRKQDLGITKWCSEESGV